MMMPAERALMTASKLATPPTRRHTGSRGQLNVSSVLKRTTATHGRHFTSPTSPTDRFIPSRSAFGHHLVASEIQQAGKRYNDEVALRALELQRRLNEDGDEAGVVGRCERNNHEEREDELTDDESTYRRASRASRPSHGGVFIWWTDEFKRAVFSSRTMRSLRSQPPQDSRTSPPAFKTAAPTRRRSHVATFLTNALNRPGMRAAAVYI